MKQLIGLIVILLTVGVKAQLPIHISPENIINITGWGDAGMLADEQHLTGADRAVSYWSPGGNEWYYPCMAVIDLKAYYHLSEIQYYDGKGEGLVSVYAGDPFNKMLLFEDSMGGEELWIGRNINLTTRFLTIFIHNKSSAPGEVLLFGRQAGPAVTEPEAVFHPRPLIRDFAGINGFIDDELDDSRASHFIREYHNWSWNEGQQGKLRFDPAYPGWDFDSYYRSLKEAGITVVPCIKQSPSWLTPHQEQKPLYAELDAENPFSYREKASFMFQYAARYGSASIDTSLLQLDHNQTRLTGLNYITFYEDWNEQDMWWHGREQWFSPFEYAAMASADNDGHGGAMGPGYGLKTADPGARLVMGGLATLDLDYIKAMRMWSLHHRGDDFPADVINLHHYSNDFGGQGEPTTGISPEEDRLMERMLPFVEYRNRYLPGKEVWVTEFGYDVHRASVQRAPAIGTFTPEQVQAMWLIRSFLALAAAGVDRAAMYMIRDAADDLAADSKFATSGLIEGKHGRKRLSWYYLKTFVNLLGNYRFEADDSTPGIHCYRFREDGSTNIIYVIWSPTSEQMEVKGFPVSMGTFAKKYSIISFSEGQEYGRVLKTGKARRLSLDISEIPVFVLVKQR